MADVGYVAAWVLAATFVLAGLAKLRQPAETARAFAGLGLRGTRYLARAVPTVELALAVALVVVPPVGGAVALALLAAFSVLLAGVLKSGKQVGCGCFGTASRQVVSFVDLVRNGMLAVLAVLTLATPSPRVPSLASVIVVVTATAIGVVVLGLCQVYSETGRLVGNEPPSDQSGDRAEQSG